MARTAPNVIILAGPNGAGKSTCAPSLLRDRLLVVEFVNADVLAQGLSGFRPDASALAAGRLMRHRLRELAARRTDFAFETTLATRSFAPWLRGLRAGGYLCHLLFLWLPTAGMAVSRVRERVAAGGHDIPEDVIRRRYHRGLDNLLSLYLPLVDSWQVFDNASVSGPLPIAEGTSVSTEFVHDATRWRQIQAARGAR